MICRDAVIFGLGLRHPSVGDILGEVWESPQWEAEDTGHSRSLRPWVLHPYFGLKVPPYVDSEFQC